jgi:4'-phosphopantetheinyl transferase EntD
VIELLLPSGVVAVEAFADVPGEPVFPGEEDLVARAVEGRRREFVTARRCAREALAKLGFPPAAIRPGSKREPIWPDGIAGAITHCKGYRAAAVVPTTLLAGIGIDAEPNGPLPEGVEESVTVAGEPEMLARLAALGPGTHWDRLLFSAKESVYKAWYPLARRWLGFEDARLTIDPAAGTFHAAILIDGPLSELTGRFVVAEGLVATAVTVPRVG